MAFVLLDLILPPRCAHCAAYLNHGQALCADCRRRIVLHRTFFCGKCRGRRYRPAGLCHQNFPFALAAATEYEDPIIQASIRALKFHFVRDAAKPLGALLAAYARRLKMPDLYDVVLPIPLSRRRERERGFNQSELIARSFSQYTGLPIDTGILKRVRHAAPQSGLKGNGLRHTNIAGSFAIHRPLTAASRNIILLDDVVTSGATMLTAAQVLRAGGAKNILALAVAKA